MAFNWSTFRTRTLTAIVFAVIMLAGLLVNQWTFLILFIIIHFGCWYEFLNLLEKIHRTSFHIYTRLGIYLVGFRIMLYFCGPVFQVDGYTINENVSLVLTTSGIVLLVLGIFRQKLIKPKAFGAVVLGLIYISLCWGLLVDLYNFHHYFPLFIIACMWINDTMAYISGSLIGKTPLSKISPNKTWEGTIGGILLSSVIVGYFAFYIDKEGVFAKSFTWWLIFAMIAAIFGAAGDLLESKLKRMAGVKDSGSIMPGHGGFLDRFDSLLLATPACYIFFKLTF